MARRRPSPRSAFRTLASLLATLVLIASSCDPPPPWEKILSAFWGGGDADLDCLDRWNSVVPQTPYIGEGSSPVAELLLGSEFELCFAGFDTAAPIALTVVDPDGTQRSLRIMSGQSTAVEPAELLSSSLRGDIILSDRGEYLSTTFAQLNPRTRTGAYNLTAVQGNRSVQATLAVGTGALGDPAHASLNPQGALHDGLSDVRTGDELEMLLLGFAPGKIVPLAVYRDTGRSDADGVVTEFAALLSPVKVNRQGWAFHTFPVPSGLATGTRYCVLTTQDLMTTDCSASVTFRVVR